jgi:hypothetical protein
MTDALSRSRRAALLAHALPTPQDRAWLLAALQPAQRALLETLLGELRELGIPPEAAMVEEECPCAPAPSAVQRLRALPRADLARLRQLCVAEPAALRARLEALVRTGGHHAAAPALDEALSRVALQRLDAHPDTKPTRFLARLRALLHGSPR